MFSFWYRKIPADVSDDLTKLVELLAYESPVREIKLFGSLTKGTWDRPRSDIDLALIFPSNYHNYSALTRVTLGYLEDSDGGKVEYSRETDELQALRQKVRSAPQLSFARRYSLHAFMEEELESFDPPFYRAIQKGRRLYLRPT